MERTHIYFFRNGRHKAIYQTYAANSDLALMKCLEETHWKMSEIIYEGKDLSAISLQNLFAPLPNTF